MKEALFVKQNKRRWLDAESRLDYIEMENPDDVADSYVDVTTDLSFARTHYPRSRTTQYLNSLAFALHSAIYRNKREKLSRIITFWTHEMPLAMYEARRELLFSLGMFIVMALIGAVSTIGDADFPRVVLGDGYVEMTLRNIENGTPMAVYDQGGRMDSFIGITLNNVMVAFRCFAMGIFTTFGAAYFLMVNGIMVGAFQTFFYQHGLLYESMLAIWLHGTLEIASIIVAGGAGTVLGNGWLFPGTYSRIESFKRGAKRGLKIIIGTVPIFIFAAFIEGFMTRHTEAPNWLRLGFILTSLAFVLFYYVWLPRHRAQEATRTS